MATYIITNIDTWCSRSVELTRYDDNIIVKTEPHEYQYLINVKSKYEENILVIRVLQELFRKNVCNNTIKLINIELGKHASMIIDVLKNNNAIEVYKSDDKWFTKKISKLRHICKKLIALCNKIIHKQE